MPLLNTGYQGHMLAALIHGSRRGATTDPRDQANSQEETMTLGDTRYRTQTVPGAGLCPLQ
jgi:hypothetical protein